MKAAALVLLGAMALSGPTSAAADTDRIAAETVFARRVQPVAPGVWLIDKPAATDPPFEGNVTVIEQTAGLVVVDAGGSPASGRSIVRRIREVSDKPVRYLIYTHYHGDHNLGAGVLKEAWPGLTVISTARTRENMTGPAMDYVKTYAASYADMAAHAARQAQDASLPRALREGWARTAAAGPGMVAGYTDLVVQPADVVFADRLSIPDALAPVEVAFLGRGNTDGDAVVWAPRQRVLAAGDLVVAPVPYAAHTYPGEWIASLEKVKAYDFAVLVPGHGAPQTDRAYLDRLIAALAEVRARVGPLARSGASLEEVRRQADLSGVRRAFAGDDAWIRFLMDAVCLNDLVANAYKEARGETVVQGKG
ncbi:MAG: MBL fold metallo-hydrolase [Phenylobacterium sp.]|uniref:MBL fold metallo-hydrolase n=1 Tax=Phenylobacterium sp. TaxID=1871053 RepID=UPI0039191CDB